MTSLITNMIYDRPPVGSTVGITGLMDQDFSVYTVGTTISFEIPEAYNNPSDLKSPTSLLYTMLIFPCRSIQAIFSKTTSTTTI
jgi:hypothetical protein